jgi:hypothetical protein
MSRHKPAVDESGERPFEIIEIHPAIPHENEENWRRCSISGQVVFLLFRIEASGQRGLRAI